MSTSLKRSFLTVIRGGSDGDGRQTGQLAVLQPPSPSVPCQLALMRTHVRRSTVISLGIDGLDYRGFCQILQEYNVQRIADIRLLAAFRGRGFNVDAVFEMFRQQDIKYERMPDLANHFIGESLNEQVVFDMFRAYLQGAQGALRHLRLEVEDGPLVLLGREAEHRGSERDVVVQLLSKVGPGFDLLVNPYHAPQLSSVIGEVDARALEDDMAVRRRKTKPAVRTKRMLAKVQHKLKLDL